MSALQPPPRPPPPGDEDLQHLYDEVWRIFDEEASQPQPSPVASKSSPNVREVLSNSAHPHLDNFGLSASNTKPPPAPPRPPRRSLGLTLAMHTLIYTTKVPPAPPVHPPETRQTLDSAVSPTTQRRLRPLPLPPGAVLPPTAAAADPHPSVSPPVPNGSRPGTANVENRRQLPQAPGGQLNGYHSSHPSTGSATSPATSLGRGPVLTPQLDTYPNVNKPVPAVPQQHAQGTDTYGPQRSESSSDIRDHVSRKPSVRPPGALAPMIPGYSNSYDEASLLDMYAEEPSKTQSGHRADASVSSRIIDNQSLLSSSDPNLRCKFPCLQQTGATLIDTDPDVGAVLGRATSTGSTASSTPPDLFSRHPTASTGPTAYSVYEASTSRDGSTMLARDDSVGSYGFSAAGPSTSLSAHGYMDSGDGYPRDSADSLDRARPNVYDAAGNVLDVVDDQVEEDEEEYFTDSDDPDPDRFVNFSLLSHLAVRLRDKVPRGTHVKSSIPYPRAFTGKDIVSTIQSQIQRELLINHGISTADRRIALQVARSLQQQLFFYEVEWNDKPLQDGVEDVYMFLDDLEGTSEGPREREELPTAVVTMLTKCYASSCSEEDPCYSFACPRRRAASVFDIGPLPEPDAPHQTEDWLSTVDPTILRSLPESEVSRQNIIYKTINQEEQYIQDLDTVEALFIKPLRHATHIMPEAKLYEFIEEVFGNILDLRECNKRLIEALYVRQREQAPIIQKIGDVFLEAARTFRYAYPTYVGHLPLAEKRLKEEMEANGELRLFLEVECTRQSARQQESRRLDVKHLLNRPSEHLQKYPLALDAIMKATTDGNPDAYYLAEAIQAIKSLQGVAQLRTFQSAMGKGPTKSKRQAIIFELIKGEMGYVKDLESIETMYIRRLREQDHPTIIPRDRLNTFISDVFHNYLEIYAHHRRLLDQLHEIQREEHPTIKSITAPLLDAALNFRDAYMEYVPHYPIAAYRIDDEMASNAEFKTFVEECVRHPDARRLDMKNFINRPIPRLLRYELLLKGILEETPQGHEDCDAIPEVLEIIKSIGKDTEPGVQSAKQKVQLWCYNANIVFKTGEFVDMDLLNENRSLIHAGKLLRQPETGFEWNGWTELFVLLFDNYLVLTKPKEKDGVTKYHVNRRPIPLDLLNLASFGDSPIQRGTSILRLGLGGGNRHADDRGGPATPGNGVPDSAGDSRLVYPCTIHYSGRLGGLYTLFTESQQSRAEWKQKLEEALGLRKVVQESNKVFEMEPLSTDTFVAPTPSASSAAPSWNHENGFTGKVTCSVPFNTADGRELVAIGCAEGVWIGFRHDSRSMRRVLHLKMVTQCAMLEDFGMFLVLADKALFAYHIEALVPSSPQSAHTSQTPQRVNGTRDVHFFSVGQQSGRTLVIYMKKKGLDSVFRVLEPVVEKINERTKAPASFTSRFGIRPARSEWFRLYREFFLPSESFDLVFLKAKIAILCTKGFEIMDLTDFKSVTIPLRDDGHERLAKRCESCKPVGMFRVENEFLLCYDEFGIYVSKHGTPSRPSGTIEWEGTAERVAMHWPYILLFDSRFIEVRHVSTGLLAQIIPGNEIRCIWDGRGTFSNLAATSGEGTNQAMNLEPRIHAVMSVPPEQHSHNQPGHGGRGRTIAQHVFEMTPTVPLYPPGPLTSPSHTGYILQPGSPPHSPSMTQNTLGQTPSWR
ncbi:hypothetical protein ID866_6590 [Astraeus odoratus]|nr:hypothetical protein ID866_6590 [Astraeus odoratus]